MRTDETTLVQQTLDNNSAAYEELVKRYQDAIFRHCYNLVRDEDIAEDLAQETFIKGYLRLSTFDQTRKFSTWLFKIATNTALDYIKRGRKLQPLTDEMASRIVATAEGPQRTAEYDELHRAVGRLDARYRTVISLYHWQGISYVEIAEIMGKPEGTIKGWLNRAKRQLRKEMS